MTLIEQRRALNFRERAPARHVVRNSAQYRSGQARSRGSRLQIIALKINGSVSGSEGVSSELNVADLAPKFQPFTAQGELRERMLSFRRKYPGPGGSTLIIQPLTLEWIVEAADLLSGTFAESMGYLNVYQRFLNNQIRKYLVCHVGLPPKAVVLACFLIEPQHAQHADESAAAPPEEDTRSAPVATSSSDSSSTEASTALGSDFGDGMGMGWLSSDENGAEIIDKLNVEGDARSITNGWAETTPGGAAAGLEVSPGKGAVLVGSVELSFSKSTRSNELTLTPPADRPYLCNFAVAEEWRGQGIGSKLLAASEELVATVGETSIYLHLRFKDKSAAAFYDKAGYTSVAEDSIFVLLLGLDRRFLMRKELNRGGGAEGRTLLKMEGAGAPADWS